MRRIASLAFLLAVTACSGAVSVVDSTARATAPTPAPMSTPTTLADPIASTTTASTTTAYEWPPGTVTCADLEEDFPDGADDHAIDLVQGTVTFFDQPDGAIQSIQFVDDPTCTADSAAWMFMIGYVLNPDVLLNDPQTACDFYLGLATSDPPPANLDTVLTHLADLEQSCK